MPSLRSPLAFLLLWVLLSPAAVHALSVIDPGQTPVTVTGAGNAELSGIAHTGGGQFLAVADSGATLHPLTVAIDPATGFVTSATAATPVVLQNGVDLEGVAWHAGSGRVWVSDEVGPAIREHDPLTGAQTGSILLPSVYGQVRTNLGLESLTLAPDGSAFWTANEASLLGDGPDADFTTGTWVRIQRFDGLGNPTGQWAYQTEPRGFVAGVVDLVALPTGELLVLERGIGPGGFEARLFLADFTGATDVSGLAGLAGASFQGVGKTLLWSRITGSLNVEGVGLGPTLSGGDLSLVLVSDGGGNAPATAFALRLVLPEPGVALLLLAALLASKARGATSGVSTRRDL